MLKRLFGKRLKEIRKSRNLTQEKLAELCNMETHSIGMIEIGRRGTTFSKIELFAEKLEIDCTELLNFKEEYKFEDSADNNVKALYREIKDFDNESLKHMITYAKSLKSLLKKKK